MPERVEPDGGQIIELLQVTSEPVSGPEVPNKIFIYYHPTLGWRCKRFGEDAIPLVDAISLNFVNRDGTVAMEADLDLGIHKTINQGDGTAPTDGATKGQMDAADAAGLSTAEAYADDVGVTAQTYTDLAVGSEQTQRQNADSAESTARQQGDNDTYNAAVALLGGVTIKSGSADPSAGGGVAATAPAIYVRSTGEVWVKNGSGDTAWVQL